MYHRAMKMQHDHAPHPPMLCLIIKKAWNTRGARLELAESIAAKPPSHDSIQYSHTNSCALRVNALPNKAAEKWTEQKRCYGKVKEKSNCPCALWPEAHHLRAPREEII